MVGDYFSYINLFQFECDRVNCRSLVLLEKQLKILDGLAPNLLTLFKQELFFLLDQNQRDYVDTCIDETNWKELKNWSSFQSEEIENAIMAYISEYRNEYTYNISRKEL